MIPRGATIQNALRFALGIFSGRIILIFRVCRTLRSAPNAIFTGGERDRERHLQRRFLRKRGAAEKRARPLSLAALASSPKGGASGETGGFAIHPETFPSCQGLSLWESCHHR